MKEAKLPIKFTYNMYDLLGYKFEAICDGWHGVGNTKKKAVDSLISVMNEFTLFNYKYVKEPKPHLIIK